MTTSACSLGIDARRAAEASLSPRDCWILRPAVFRYRLGSLVLRELKITALVLDANFSQPEDTGPDVATEFQRLPEGVDVVVVRAQPIAKPLPRITVLPHVLRCVTDQYPRCYITLTGTFSDYLQRNFSSKTRNTLRRKVRKFAEASGGEVCWRQYATPEEMQVFHRLAREISRQTYQEKLLRNKGLPTGEQFMRQMLELARADSVRGFILFLKGDPVSYLYMPATDGVLYYDCLGYKPEVSHLCPGTVLQYLALERLFAEGKFRLLDFGEGKPGEQKRLFATGSVLCAEMFFFRRSWQNLLRVTVQGGLSAISETTSEALEALGLKNDLRKLLRRIACSFNSFSPEIKSPAASEP